MVPETTHGYEEQSVKGLYEELPNLETFPNRFPKRNYKIRIVEPEYTSVCLSGSTLVDVCCDEREFPKGIPIKDLVGSQGFVFSFDEKLYEPVVRPYFNVRRTRREAPLVHLEMLSRKGLAGERKEGVVGLDLTPDHEVLVITGHWRLGWVAVKDLKVGNRILSDQRPYGKPNRDDIRGKPRHRLIAEAVLGRSLFSYEDAHHRDHEHFNNNPSNIEVLTKGGHFSHHQAFKYGYESKLSLGDLANEYTSDKTVSVLQLANKYSCDHSTIQSRLLRAGVKLRSQSEILLARGASVNHKVISVSPIKRADVYNMEVAGTSCFFANEVVVHNCPKTGMPDFGTITITYIAEDSCLELKALKYYMYAFRNLGIFYENLVNRVLDDIVDAAHPRAIRVQVDMTPRGGISSHLEASAGRTELL